MVLSATGIMLPFMDRLVSCPTEVRDEEVMVEPRVEPDRTVFAPMR